MSLMLGSAEYNSGFSDMQKFIKANYDLDQYGDQKLKGTVLPLEIYKRFTEEFSLPEARKEMWKEHRCGYRLSSGYFMYRENWKDIFCNNTI